MCEYSAADGFGGDFCDAELFVSLDAGDVVVVCESFVEDGEVGIDEIEDGEVVPEDVVEEAACFGEHGFLEKFVEFGEESSVGRGEFDVAEVEPLAGEVFDEAGDTWVFDHAFDLLSDDFGIGEFVLFGEFEELVIGHGGPEEV